MSPKDIVVAKPRDKDDHVEWLIQQQDFDTALEVSNSSFCCCSCKGTPTVGFQEKPAFITFTFLSFYIRAWVPSPFLGLRVQNKSLTYSCFSYFLPSSAIPTFQEVRAHQTDLNRFKYQEVGQKYFHHLR